MRPLYCKLRKGSGMAIIGSSITVLCAILALALMQSFMINQTSADTQNAADFIADSVAYETSVDHMEYQEAAIYAEQLKSIANDNLDINLTEVELRNQEYDEGQARVTVKNQNNYDYLRPDNNTDSYVIPRVATTQWMSPLPNNNYINSLDPAVRQLIARNMGNPVIARAVEHLGRTQYVWGGGGPTGLDCSGLVGYALTGQYGHQAGYTAGMGPSLQPSMNPEPGDVCCTPGQGHTGIYVGTINGVPYMIHASYPDRGGPGVGVVCTPVNPGMNIGKLPGYSS